MPKNSKSNSSGKKGNLNRNPSAGHNIFNKTMTILAYVFAAIALLPLLLILAQLIWLGSRHLGIDLFTQLPPPAGLEDGGIGNAIIGTLVTTGIGALMAIPFGVLAAIYLSEFARGSAVGDWIGFSANVLSGIPSIIAGVFAYSLIVLATGTFSAVAGGFALGVLMVPIIVRTSVEALELVPENVRHASMGLGAADYQGVFRVVLPAAAPGIITGIMLGLARAAGSAAPLLFTALSYQYWMYGLFHPTPTIPVLIYNYATNPYEYQQELAWSASLVIVTFVLAANLAARWAARQIKS
jgi:phosphate transport system permease protein